VCFALKLVWKNNSSANTHTAPAGHSTAPPPVGFPQDLSQKVLTAWSRVVLEKLTGFQPVKKFLAF
jgi:hypothetical protein